MTVLRNEWCEVKLELKIGSYDVLREGKMFGVVKRSAEDKVLTETHTVA